MAYCSCLPPLHFHLNQIYPCHLLCLIVTSWGCWSKGFGLPPPCCHLRAPGRCECSTALRVGASRQQQAREGTVRGGAGPTVNPGGGFLGSLSFSSLTPSPLLWLWTALPIPWLSSEVGRSWPRTQCLGTGLGRPCCEAAEHFRLAGQPTQSPRQLQFA